MDGTEVIRKPGEPKHYALHSRCASENCTGVLVTHDDHRGDFLQGTREDVRGETEPVSKIGIFGMFKGESRRFEESSEHGFRKIVALFFHVSEPLICIMSRGLTLLATLAEPEQVAESEVGAASEVLSEEQAAVPLEYGGV